MPGSESVFNLIQFGAQSGTAYSPGSAVPATVLVPVDSPVTFDLDRASQFPKQDRGRNVRNSAGQGYNGIRGAGCTLPTQVSFEYLMDFLEMHACGGVVPTGGPAYVWTYPFEALTPTTVPRTIEGGNTDASQTQMQLSSCLVDQLTMGFQSSEFIVIGGGLMDPESTSEAFRARYLRIIRETMEPNLWPAQRGRITIVPAALGELSQSIGAALVALNQSKA